MNKKTRVEIVLCETCKGEGFTTRHELTDYHKREYDVFKDPCRRCNDTGRLKITTTTEEAPYAN